MTAFLLALFTVNVQAPTQGMLNRLSAEVADTMDSFSLRKVFVIAALIVAAYFLLKALRWLFDFIAGHKQGAFRAILLVVTLLAFGLFIEKQLYVRAKTAGGYVTKIPAGEVIIGKFADDLNLEELKTGDTVQLKMHEESAFVSAHDTSILPGGTVITAQVVSKRRDANQHVVAQIDFRSVKVPGQKAEHLKGFVTMSGTSEAELVKMRKESAGSIGLVLAWAAAGTNPIFILGGFGAAVIGSDLIQRLTDAPPSYLRWTAQDGNHIKKDTLIGIRLFTDLYVHL